MYNEFEYFVTMETEKPLYPVGEDTDMWFLKNEGNQIDKDVLHINDELLLLDI